MSDEFIEIARFASRMEAEAVGHALDPHGIPFVVQSDDIGIFGPGHAGRTLSGAGLLIPAAREKEVRQLLECVVRPDADGDSTDV